MLTCKTFNKRHDDEMVRMDSLVVGISGRHTEVFLVLERYKCNIVLAVKGGICPEILGGVIKTLHLEGNRTLGTS